MTSNMIDGVRTDHSQLKSNDPYTRGYSKANLATLFTPKGVLGVVGRVGKLETMINAESAKLISSSKRISSNIVNEPFISEEAAALGWRAPYPKNITIREIVGSKDISFARVHTDPSKPAGGFLVREKVLSQLGYDSNKIQHYLGLPDVPIYITDVNVPAGSRLYVGRIGAQPSFGLMTESGFQYQLKDIIPSSNFTNTRLLPSFVEERISFASAMRN
jgi:hypothetical protein